MAKLKPRARIIRTIGDQLISGPEAAIIELVKNSYDADSPKVEITFNYSDSEGFSLIIKDYGHGMTYKEITENWLEPATDIKVRNNKSKSGSRKLLGAKGIGRFAVSRLGDICLLTSYAKVDESDNTEYCSICVDWRDFTGQKYLDEIEIDIERRECDDSHKTGVEIEVTKLRDKWSFNNIKRLILELRRLSRAEHDEKFEIYLELDAFTKENSGFSGPHVLEEFNDSLIEKEKTYLKRNLIQPYSLVDIADYQLIGEFNNEGIFLGTFQIQRGDKKQVEIKVLAPNLDEDERLCGKVFIKLNIFDREHESVQKLFERMGLNFQKIGIKKARQILNDNAGISIIRNGFRIRPYGDSDHDWLDLQGKRVQDPSKRLGSDQVSGYVVIEEEEKSGVVERSSREGLEVNGNYRRLVKLLGNLFPHIEEKRFEFREKAGLGRKTTSNVEKVRKAAQLKATYKALNHIPKEFREKVEKAVKKDTDSISHFIDEVDEYQKILQSRASLGLVVAEVIHEGRRLLDPLLSSSRRLLSDQKHAFEDSKLGILYRKTLADELKTINIGGTGISRLFKRLDPLSGRKRGRPGSFDIQSVISDSLSVMMHQLKENNIALHLEVSEKLTGYGYKEDLQAGIFNIVENAIHWLSTVKDKEKYINITVRTARRKCFIEICNNGPSIEESYYGRLFEAGFSLKSDGTGLGLAIAREACRASKGDIKLLSERVNTTFVIEFRRGES